MFALIDCNNFYASCERVFNPALIGKPIVVLSNNDGCVIARSNEAKKMGIKMGAPAFQSQSLFKLHQVTVFSANFALYGDMSNRIMTLLQAYCTDIEIYSIDEAFLKLTGFEKYLDIQEYGIHIQKKILQCTGIQVSIGIAATKSLAKLANKIAKKFPQKTNNVYVINDAIKIEKALKWLPIEDVWGIGKQHSKRLKAFSIHTAQDFVLYNKMCIKKWMGIVGYRLQRDLSGLPTLDLETLQSKKSISVTRSFEKNYTELTQLQERICTFAVSCAEKLRKEKKHCNTMMVFIHTNPFKKDTPQYSKNMVLSLPYPSNSNITLSKIAQEALIQIFKPNYAYKKAGVIVMDFTNEHQYQLQLFNNENPKHPTLMKAIDNINHQYGSHTIKLANQNIKKMWTMKQEMLSPKYTTKLSDIIKIYV